MCITLLVLLIDQAVNLSNLKIILNYCKISRDRCPSLPKYSFRRVIIFFNILYYFLKLTLYEMKNFFRILSTELLKAVRLKKRAIYFFFSIYKKIFIPITLLEGFIPCTMGNELLFSVANRYSGYRAQDYWTSQLGLEQIC